MNHLTEVKGTSFPFWNPLSKKRITKCLFRTQKPILHLSPRTEQSKCWYHVSSAIPSAHYESNIHPFSEHLIVAAPEHAVEGYGLSQTGIEQCKNAVIPSELIVSFLVRSPFFIFFLECSKRK